MGKIAVWHESTDEHAVNGISEKPEISISIYTYFFFRWNSQIEDEMEKAKQDLAS